MPPQPVDKGLKLIPDRWLQADLEHRGTIAVVRGEKRDSDSSGSSSPRGNATLVCQKIYVSRFGPCSGEGRIGTGHPQRRPIFEVRNFSSGFRRKQSFEKYRRAEVRIIVLLHSSELRNSQKLSTVTCCLASQSFSSTGACGVSYVVHNFKAAQSDQSSRVSG